MGLPSISQEPGAHRSRLERRPPWLSIMLSRPFKRPENVVAGVNLAQPDITLRLDQQGVIREVTLSDQIAEEGVEDLVGKPWEATVGDVGGAKVRLMLQQALTEGVSAFRQVNQHFPSGTELPIEFTTEMRAHREKSGLIANPARGEPGRRFPARPRGPAGPPGAHGRR